MFVEYGCISTNIEFRVRKVYEGRFFPVRRKVDLLKTRK